MDAKYVKAAVISCAVALLTTISAASRAGNESASYTIFRLDGHPYTKSELIEDFTQIAFSNFYWNQRPNETVAEYRQRQIEWKYCGEKRKWGRPYTCADDLSRIGVITKWPNDISIGIDWPSGKDTRSAARVRANARLEARIPSLLPRIEEVTGLRINLAPALDEAPLRIIPLVSDEGHFFKPWRGINGDVPTSHIMVSTQTPWTHDQMLGGLAFTPDLRAQAGGFLVTDAEGNITHAPCMVGLSAGRDMRDALLAECLLRTLGLPNAPERTSGGVLTAWNKNFEPEGSRKLGVDPSLSPKPNALQRKLEKLLPSKKREELRQARIRFPTEKLNFAAIPDGFSEYDLMMVRMLYCDAIKVGMTKDEARSTLLTHSECFENNSKKGQ